MDARASGSRGRAGGHGAFKLHSVWQVHENGRSTRSWCNENGTYSRCSGASSWHNLKLASSCPIENPRLADEVDLGSSESWVQKLIGISP
jgi:hypothetical protein